MRDDILYRANRITTSAGLASPESVQHYPYFTSEVPPVEELPKRRPVMHLFSQGVENGSDPIQEAAKRLDFSEVPAHGKTGDEDLNQEQAIPMAQTVTGDFELNRVMFDRIQNGMKYRLNEKGERQRLELSFVQHTKNDIYCAVMTACQVYWTSNLPLTENGNNMLESLLIGSAIDANLLKDKYEKRTEQITLKGEPKISQKYDQLQEHVNPRWITVLVNETDTSRILVSEEDFISKTLERVESLGIVVTNVEDDDGEPLNLRDYKKSWERAKVTLNSKIGERVQITGTSHTNKTFRIKANQGLKRGLNVTPFAFMYHNSATSYKDITKKVQSFFENDHVSVYFDAQDREKIKTVYAELDGQDMLAQSVCSLVASMFAVWGGGGVSYVVAKKDAEITSRPGTQLSNAETRSFMKRGYKIPDPTTISQIEGYHKRTLQIVPIALNYRDDNRSTILNECKNWTLIDTVSKASIYEGKHVATVLRVSMSNQSWSHWMTYIPGVGKWFDPSMPQGRGTTDIQNTEYAKAGGFVKDVYYIVLSE